MLDILLQFQYKGLGSERERKIKKGKYLLLLMIIKTEIHKVNLTKSS